VGWAVLPLAPSCSGQGPAGGGAVKVTRPAPAGGETPAGKKAKLSAAAVASPAAAAAAAAIAAAAAAAGTASPAV
jgi:hypothetical protein